MNGRLRTAIQQILSIEIKKIDGNNVLRLTSQQEEIVGRIKNSLLSVKNPKEADLILIQNFYKHVRAAHLRNSLTALPTILPNEKPVPDTLTSSARVRLPFDPFQEMQQYSQKDKLDLLTRRAIELREILTRMQNQEHLEDYLIHANKIADLHRSLVRIMGLLSWESDDERKQCFTPLQNMHNRMEDFGWQCTAGKALGLVPKKIDEQMYDGSDFHKKSMRFFESITEKSFETGEKSVDSPYKSLKKSIDIFVKKIMALKIENGNVSLPTSKLSPAVSSTTQVSRRLTRSSQPTQIPAKESVTPSVKELHKRKQPPAHQVVEQAESESQKRKLR